MGKKTLLSLKNVLYVYSVYYILNILCVYFRLEQVLCRLREIHPLKLAKVYNYNFIIRALKCRKQQHCHSLTT